MSDSSDVGIAIVGPGAIGDVHAASLRAGGMRVQAIVGTVPSEVSDFAAKHEVSKTYGHLDELLADDRVHAVIVATPSPLHVEQTLAVLDSGRHVLCEIPFALSAAEAHTVVERARTVDRIAMAGHTLRYWEPHIRLQEALVEHEIAPTHVVVRSLMLRQTNQGWTGRTRDWTDSVLWHQGGHAVDAALWHLRAGAEFAVTGHAGARWPATGTVMDVSAVIATPDRRLGNISLSYHSRTAVSDFLIISPEHTFGVTEGRLVIDGEITYEAASAAAAQSAAVVAQDMDFVHAVADGRAPATAIDQLLPLMSALQSLDDLC